MKFTSFAIGALVTVAIAAPTSNKALTVSEADVHAETETGAILLTVDLDDAINIHSYEHSSSATRSNPTRRTFNNADSLISSLSDLVVQVKSYGDSINSTLLNLKTQKISKSQATTDSIKALGKMRALLSGFISSFSGTRNLNFDNSQRKEVVSHVTDLTNELLNILNKLVGALGLRLDLNSSLNPLMGLLSNLLGGLTRSDRALGPDLKKKLAPLISAKVGAHGGNGGGSGLGALLGNILSPVSHLLKALDVSVN
ncbi:hypothetical protein FZEAL_5337 [Fusarium zealandicum]|uniref:Uncharacterized protein n=1 Tax=Fusarium zealandicum TaxID=1053134 RepID=A0A8H4XJV5_9HYPO|nr:hypothetical protein FZEAL_5337 [Fusarium zealandicum]